MAKQARIRNIDLLKKELAIALSVPDIIMKQNGYTKAQYRTYVEGLQSSIERSKVGKRSKNKGSEFERKVAKAFNDVFPVTLVRTPMSGGFQKSKESNLKGDVSNIDPTVDFLLHTECKNQKSWAMKQWFKQSEDDCPDGKIPIVVVHQQQEVTDGKRTQQAGEFVFLRLQDFVNIVDVDKVVKRREKPRRPIRRTLR